MPAAATKLKDIEGGKNSLHLQDRPHCVQSQQLWRTDATDAQNLLENVSAKEPCKLSSAQKEAVLAGLADVIKYGGQSDKWWKTKLGLT